MRGSEGWSDGPAAHPSEDAEALTRELSNDLMSPYCPGRTIASCPSQAARKLESYIMEQAEHGKTREEIESDLVARFPGIAGYAGRPVVVYGSAGAAILAAAIVTLMVRRWLARAKPRDDLAPSLSGAPGSESDRLPLSGVTRHDRQKLEDALERIEEF